LPFIDNTFIIFILRFRLPIFITMKISKQLLNAPVLGSALAGLGEKGNTLGQLGSRWVRVVKGGPRAAATPKAQATAQRPAGWQKATSSGKQQGVASALGAQRTAVQTGKGSPRAAATPKAQATAQSPAGWKKATSSGKQQGVASALGTQRTAVQTVKDGFAKIDRIPEAAQRNAAGKPVYTQNEIKGVMRAATGALHNAQHAADRLETAKHGQKRGAQADYTSHYSQLRACIQDALRCAGTLAKNADDQAKVEAWQAALNKLPHAPKPLAQGQHTMPGADLLQGIQAYLEARREV
jgi:hypothetical protein